MGSEQYTCLPLHGRGAQAASSGQDQQDGSAPGSSMPYGLPSLSEIAEHSWAPRPPDLLLRGGNHAPKPLLPHPRPSPVLHPEASRRALEGVPSFVSCMSLHLPACPHLAMVLYSPCSSKQTQELLFVLFVTLHDFQRKLWGVMRSYLGMMQQLVTMECSFLPRKPAVSHTPWGYSILHPRSILSQWLPRGYWGWHPQRCHGYNLKFAELRPQEIRKSKS